MDWIITYLLMALTIGAFYFIIYKWKESFIFASLAIFYYVVCLKAVGMVFLNLESIFSCLFNSDFSSSVFKIIFWVMKMIYFISVPMPVILTYCRVKRIKKNMEDKKESEY